MFAFLKAKRRGMRRLLGWSNSNRLRSIRDPRSSLPSPRECKIIARRWEALALKAETAHQRELHERIADGWREMADR